MSEREALAVPMLAAGATMDGICAELGVSKTTAATWRKRHAHVIPQRPVMAPQWECLAMHDQGLSYEEIALARSDEIGRRVSRAQVRHAVHAARDQLARGGRPRRATAGTGDGAQTPAAVSREINEGASDDPTRR
jgi:hypothetical protein